MLLRIHVDSFDLRDTLKIVLRCDESSPGFHMTPLGPKALVQSSSDFDQSADCLENWECIPFK